MNIPASDIVKDFKQGQPCYKSGGGVGYANGNNRNGAFLVCSVARECAPVAALAHGLGLVLGAAVGWRGRDVDLFVCAEDRPRRTHGPAPPLVPRGGAPEV